MLAEAGGIEVILETMDAHKVRLCLFGLDRGDFGVGGCPQGDS